MAGVYGQTGSAASVGVWGYNSTSGTGVRGGSQTGMGLYGTTVLGAIAISGDAFTIGGIGVRGLSFNGTGVKGLSNSANDLNSNGNGTGSGVQGRSGSGRGVFGEATTGQGVRGYSNTAVDNSDAAGSGIGVHGKSGSGPGVKGESTGAAGVHGFSVNQPGVDGVSTNHLGLRGTSTNFVGIVGISTNSHGLYGSSASPGNYGIIAENTTPGGGPGLFVTGSAFINGSLQVTGAKNAVIKMQDGSDAVVYCQEAPEPYFEDFGRAQLTGGVANVQLEREFAQLTAGGDYMVFLAPEGVSGGLYVSSRNANGFEVRAENGARSLSFTYRIVTKRKDIQGKRFDRVSLDATRNVAATRAALRIGNATPESNPGAGPR